MPYARLITVGLNLGAVANGVPFDKVTAVGITRSVAAPGTTAPSWILNEMTLENQSDLYRLNGDYNPLHIGGLPLFCNSSAVAVLKRAGNLLVNRPRCGSEARLRGSNPSRPARLRHRYAFDPHQLRERRHQSSQGYLRRLFGPRHSWW